MWPRWMESTWPALLAALAAVVVFGWTATRSTLWDRDESNFGEATVELLQGRDWLVPTFAGRLRPDKPILVYWLMAPCMAALGPTATAARLPAVLASAATLLLTWAVGRRLLGARSGLLAMGVLATTPLAAEVAVAATTDSVLLASMLLAVAALVWSAGERMGWRGALLFAAGVGLAQLVKGPVGLGLPLLTAVGAALFGHRDRLLRSRDWGWMAGASMLGFAAFAAWGIPANARTGGELARRGIGHHVVARMAGPLEGHGGPWWMYLPYYLVVIAVAFFPWTLYLPGAISALAGGRLGGRRSRALLLGWIVPTLVLMTAVATKLPHYVLMIWPALAIAVAGVVVAAEEGRLAPRDLRRLRAGVWVLAPVAIMLVAALLSAAIWSPVAGVAAPLAGCGALLAATCAVAIREHWQGRWRRGAMTLLVGMLAAGLLLAWRVIPRLDAVKAGPTLAVAVAARVPPTVPLAMFRDDAYDQPGLVFHLDRLPIELLDREDEVVAWARRPGPGLLVLTSRHWRDLASVASRLGVQRVASVHGFDYVHGRWLDVVALRRGRAAAPAAGSAPR